MMKLIYIYICISIYCFSVDLFANQRTKHTMFMCVCVYVCACVYVCMCVYVWCVCVCRSKINEKTSVWKIFSITCFYFSINKFILTFIDF